MTMDLKYEFYIGAPPERVWQALVSEPDTKKIYYGSALRSSFEAGAPFQYVGPGPEGKDVVHIRGKVLKYEPNKVFQHSYIVGDTYIPGHEKFESHVTYELEPLGNCTKLTVTHDHWTEGDPAYENTAKGWWKLLCSIKTLVETGKPLDFSVH